MPSHIHIGTPEWEREDWQGVTESQTSPDGFYYQGPRSARGGGIIRRGSGGGGGMTPSRGGRPSSPGGRSVSLGLQGVVHPQMGPTVGLSTMDPYAHTKKTRTKPIRNADGVLIRKDGRPDMRSQSSAANLRKVHARKEDGQPSEHGFTPTNLHQSESLAATETPSPTRTMHASTQDMPTSVERRHTAVMGKMFPGGVDESRKEHDLAHKVFEEDQEHAAQSHSHNHHLHHHRDHIKRETHDDRIPNSQSPRDQDVDMDRLEDHADDEGQTPSGHSDNSGISHDEYMHRQEQAQRPKEVDTPIEPQSIGGSTQTIGATPATVQS